MTQIPAAPPNTANRQIARAAGVVMAGFVLSNLAGLFRTILVADVFGTQGELDAFNAAIRLPDTLFMVVAGGALASAFIPTLTGLLTRQRNEDAWRLISALLNLVSLVLVAASVLAWFAAPWIVENALGRDFPLAQQQMTASLLRILLISPAIFGASGLLMGVLNAHQHFLLPALAPTLHWVGYILGLYWFVPRLGIHGLAWGAVLGAALHLAVQLPGLRRLDWHYSLSLGLDFPAVREVARLMAPRLLGVAVVQLNFWINVILASGMPTGSLTALDYAWRVMTMPQVVIAQAIAIAALPTFSAQAERKAFGEMRTSLAATLRGVLFLSVPALFGVILLRYPVIQMFFQRGAFTDDSAELVAWALLWYTAGLVSHAVVEVVSRSFYALHDTKTPVAIGIAAMGLNIAFSLLLADWFEGWGLPPHGGLALANTTATTLEMGVLVWVMRRRLGGLDGRSLFQGAWQSLAAALVMSAVLVAWLAWPPGASHWLVGLGGIALGGGVYALVVLLLRVDEAWLLLDAVRRRLYSQNRS